MKRPTSVPGAESGAGSCTDPTWSKRFPVLVSYMTDSKWDDGKPREVSTVSINFSTGCANVGLSDHALQRSAYTTADTVETALKLLEAALAGETASWRPWKASRAKK